MAKNKNILIAFLIILALTIMVSSSVILIINSNSGGSTGDNFNYTIEKNKVIITGYTGQDKVITIPSKIKGKRVSEIGEEAFLNNNSITSITFEDSSTTMSLQKGAFKGAKSLVVVTLPSVMDSIGQEAFYGCSSLSHITMPNSIKTIENYAFYDCSSLEYDTDIDDKKLVLPTSLTSIGDYAFYNCSSLKKVIVSNELTQIGNNAFQKCRNLVDFQITQDNNIQSIGDYCFSESRLKSSVETPLSFRKLQQVGKYAFANIATNFEYFLIPSSINNLGDYAFSNSRLAKVDFETEQTLSNEGLGIGVFSDMGSLTNIGVVGDDSTTIVGNRLPQSITSIPAKTFSGSFKLFNSKDFNIGAAVTSIGDGAFAIYYKDNNVNSGNNSNYWNYTKFTIAVDINNQNFKSISLPKYFNAGDSTGKDHSVLMDIKDAHNTILLAYIGGYNANSKMDKDSLESGEEFKFLTQQSEIVDNIAKIGAYAFSGVNFKELYIPTRNKSVGNYAFSNSKINAVYFQNPNCQFYENTFDGILSSETSMFTIILIGGGSGTIEEFVKDKDNIEFRPSN